MKKIDFDNKRVFSDKYIDKLFRDMVIFDYVRIVNGCSPSFLPDFIAGQVSGDFYLACARHDLAYWLGGNFKDKYAADLRFDKDMGKVVEIEGTINNVRYGVRKEIFYNLVHFFGDSSFNHWGRKGGVARGHLPSYDVKKSAGILEFEKKHGVRFVWERVNKLTYRWNLNTFDTLKVQEILINTI